MLERRLIAVEGVVQGVGFRPFVHRLASAGNLRGSVRNGSAGVMIDIEGSLDSVDDFCRSLSAMPPALAIVNRVRIARATPQSYSSFLIVPSESHSAEEGTALTSADVATCDACLAELFDPTNRRFGHPFITCTDCGPRFTIVRETPYDRERTTMALFDMCGDCRREYENPVDRRFHAEAIACPRCGPTLRLESAFAATFEPGPVTGDEALGSAVSAVLAGHIVGIKALGGFHLACDAANEHAVSRLRTRKRRAAKPFAVMVRTADQAGALSDMTPEERRLLESPARPIVIVTRRIAAAIAPSVAPNQRTLGVMLPSTPLHHLLLAALGRPLVMTSGNRSDEPVAIDDASARAELAGVADVLLTHDRPIAARCDDSVVRIVSEAPTLLRRARGYAPRTITLASPAPRPVLALGGHLKNTVCLVNGANAFLSPHVGDLDSFAARRALRDVIDAVTRAAGATPEVIAHDLHPDYASTRVAEQIAQEQGIGRRVAVQHHHAHVAACAAEYRRRGPMIGVTFDGAGLGTDGAIWGGEFLVVDGAQYRRHGHLAYIALPGGDVAARQPWRSAAAHLSRAGLGEGSSFDLRPEGVEERDWKAIHQLLSRGGDGMPRTSSVGRLFDAVASLLDLSHVSRFEGEAAMALESVADPRARSRYSIGLTDGDAWTADPAEMIRHVVEDKRRGVNVSEIAGAFHVALRDLCVRGCERIRAETNVSTVVLTGGVFQNLLLIESAAAALTAARFEVLIPREAPCNDGGLSLGQAYVAACALEEDLCA